MLDVYEFTQALRRQRRLLIAGVVMLLLGTVFLTFKPSANGLEPRIGPRYETSARMVVTDSSVGSLANAPTGGDAMAHTAAFFESLLLGPDAIRDITAETGVQLQEFQVATLGAMLTVRTVADTPEGAVAGALGAYEWLTHSLDKPLDLVTVTPTTAPESLLDEQGRIDAAIKLDVSPAFAESGDGLWVVLSTNGNDFKSASLVDAALEDVEIPPVAIKPGGELTVTLEDVMRNELDTLEVPVPQLAGPDYAPHTLEVRVDRDAVIGIKPASDGATGENGEESGEDAAARDVSEAELVPARVGLSWEVGELIEPTTTEPLNIGLSLLTQDPIPFQTGARRGPILSMAALFGGAFALFAMAIAVDSWQQAHRNQATAAYNDRLAIVRPLNGDIQYEGRGPLSHRLRAAGDSKQPPPPEAQSGE